MQDTEKSEIIRLKEVIESLRAELESITSAADRNSVKLAKVTRQNGMYFKLIDESDKDHRVQLNEQKKKFENEIRQIKTKQWCAVCLKEGMFSRIFL